MSGPGAAVGRGWTWARWVAAVGLVVAVQAGLIWLLSEREPLPVVSAGSGTRIEHVPGVGLGPDAQEFLRLIDPAGSVLPSPEGFSGAAWLQRQPMEYQAAEWEGEAAWLGPVTTNFGALARDWSRGGRVHLWREPERPRTQTDRVQVRGVPVRSRSSCRVEGELAGRGVVAMPEVPSLSLVEAVTNTVVEVLVNARGIPFSAVVVGGSGSASADRLAVDLARAVRFSPLGAVLPVGAGPGALERGVLRFYWHTVEPTNRVEGGVGPGA